MAIVNRRVLREKREVLGYSQEELARIAQLSLRRYVDIETKETNPSLDTLSAIAAALHCLVADLLDE